MKPHNVGDVAVLGVCFGFGGVDREALTAVTVITINVLSVGLVQTGEALLKGRGKSAMYRFADGFADSLAEGTADKPRISQTDFQRYQSMDWKYKLKTYGQLYLDNGNDASYAHDVRCHHRMAKIQIPGFDVRSGGRR